VYAALGMALWSGAAAVIAPLGPEYPRERFPALDFSRARTLAHTMRNWGLYENDGTRHFLSRRDSLPWDAFSPDASDLDDATAYGASHIAPMPWRRVVAIVDALRARDATISLDLHDRVLAAIAPDDLTAVLERVDLFFPSRQDTDVVYPGASPLAALRALRARLPRVPVLGVKCGADGAFVHAAGAPDAIAVPSAAAAVVDATGAGDAFCGGFLAAYAASGDAAEATLAGTVAASYALAAVGPSALASASRAQAEARVSALRPRLQRIAFAVP
jgi:sugar/nucleoside kinase (ribokinase family)